MTTQQAVKDAEMRRARQLALTLVSVIAYIAYNGILGSPGIFLFAPIGLGVMLLAACRATKLNAERSVKGLWDLSIKE